MTEQAKGRGGDREIDVSKRGEKELGEKGEMGVRMSKKEENTTYAKHLPCEG